ncbi:GNAT family N-acetyltransferase [Piscinibacter sp. XHJ-5]|uniref:GNAT family N-acetyltransferase n=1 Tax=Piscinibacter sp. XHJ-5 TaxID=3037797 RepID=UPI00245308A4|nr:GNAT family N-acetyltransferase [Piscinibacter sp. XHJ-5]
MPAEAAQRSGMWYVRHPQAADRPALIDICLRTGHDGGDARSRYADPGLLAEIFLLPYLELEPLWCWLGEDDAGIAGYIVATPDTREYASRGEQQWWPALRRRHPLPDPDREGPQADLTRRAHAGVPTHMDFLDTHPAHLHIDLLPRAQGRGLGAHLMATLLEPLQTAGVPGVHLGVSASNPRANAFYERLAFEVLEQAAWGRWMGRRLALPPPVTA